MVNVSAYSSIVLSRGFDFDVGPLPLFTAGPHAGGTYQFNYRVVNPVTQEELSFGHRER